MYLYQNNKACENLLLYIFKHDISRKSTVQILLVFVCKKKQKLQCSGLTSKHSNFVCYCFLLFDVNLCFVFARQILDVFTIFSELSGLKRNVLFMEIYMYQ